MAIRSVTLELEGVEEIKRRYKALPKQIERAAINATNQQGTSAKKTITGKIFRGTRIRSEGLVKRNINVKRVDVKRNRLKAQVDFTGRRIPLRYWRTEYRQPARKNAHPTRAYVVAYNSIKGKPEVIWSFVNPLGKYQVRQARYAKYNYKKTTHAHGMSIRKPFDESLDKALLAQTQAELQERFIRAVQKQVTKGR